MGFKCPLCKKDFGNNKDAWKEHINKCNGVGVDKLNDNANGISIANAFVNITTSVEKLPKQSELESKAKRKLKKNKKMHSLIDITCSVPEVDVLENSAVFKADFEEDKYAAIIAMAKALRLLSKNTVYEAEILELLCRCGMLLNFSAEEIKER